VSTGRDRRGKGRKGKGWLCREKRRAGGPWGAKKNRNAGAFEGFGLVLGLEVGEGGGAISSVSDPH